MNHPNEDFIGRLDRKVDKLLADIERSEPYLTLVDPGTDQRLLTAILRNILLDVFSYGPHLSAATFTSIGRMSARTHFMRPLIMHILEEVPHAELALRGYVLLGGDEAFARANRINPASFAVAAVARMLAEHESPFSYLGYIYLKESTTAVVAARVQEALRAKKIDVEFVTVHAGADTEHAAYLREQIGRIVREAPEEAGAIEYGFDCYSSVYPHPVWAGALQRARREMES